MGRGLIYHGKGVNILLVVGSIYHRYGGRYAMDRGRYSMGRGVDKPWVGGRYAIDMGVNMPWVEGSIYHG